MKWDKEKIALAVAGSVVSTILGYLVWRHEQSISAATYAQQQANAQAQSDEIAQELAALPQYSSSGGGGGIADEPVTTGSESGIEAVPTDTALEQILQAFYPTTTTGTTGTTGTTTTPSTQGPDNPAIIESSVTPPPVNVNSASNIRNTIAQPILTVKS